MLPNPPLVRGYLMARLNELQADPGPPGLDRVPEAAGWRSFVYLRYQVTDDTGQRRRRSIPLHRCSRRGIGRHTAGTNGAQQRAREQRLQKEAEELNGGKRNWKWRRTAGN